MKNGMQMLLESFLEDKEKQAIEQCKQIIPAMPELIENIKWEWNASKDRQEQTLRLLERIVTQNNLILDGLESLGYKVDTTKAEELPPTLAHHLSNGECSICEALIWEHSPEQLEYCKSQCKYAGNLKITATHSFDSNGREIIPDGSNGNGNHHA